MNRPRSLSALTLALVTALVLPADAAPMAPGLPRAATAAQLPRDPTPLATAVTPVEAFAPDLTADTDETSANGELAREIADQQQAAELAVAHAEEGARLAAQERIEALERLRRAASDVSRAVAREEARLAEIRLALAQFQGALGETRGRHADAASARLVWQRTLGVAVDDPNLTVEAAGARYDETVIHLEAARDAFSEALVELSGDQRVPVVAPPPRRDLLGRASAAEQHALAAALEALQVEADRLDAEDQALRTATAADLARHLRSVNDLRIALIGRVSSTRRSELLGFTRAGLAQFGRELRHLQLMIAWYPRSWLQWAGRFEDLEDIVLAVGAASWTLAKLLVLLVIAWLFRRRWRVVVAGLRVTLAARLGEPTLRRWLEAAFRTVVAVGPEAGWLIGLMSLFDLVLDAETSSELAVVRAVVMAWAWYRLILAGAVGALTAAASTAERTVDAQLADRILRSVRLVARVGLGIHVAIVLAGTLLGEGYLYTQVVRFFWIAALPIAWILLRRWREDIARA